MTKKQLASKIEYYQSMGITSKSEMFEYVSTEKGFDVYVMNLIEKDLKGIYES